MVQTRAQVTKTEPFLILTKQKASNLPEYWKVEKNEEEWETETQYLFLLEYYFYNVLTVILYIKDQ